MDIVEGFNKKYSIKDLLDKDIAVRIKDRKSYLKLQSLIEAYNEQAILQFEAIYTIETLEYNMQFYNDVNNSMNDICIHIGKIRQSSRYIMVYRGEGFYHRWSYMIIEIERVLGIV